MYVWCSEGAMRVHFRVSRVQVLVNQKMFFWKNHVYIGYVRRIARINQFTQKLKLMENTKYAIILQLSPIMCDFLTPKLQLFI